MLLVQQFLVKCFWPFQLRCDGDAIGDTNISFSSQDQWLSQKVTEYSSPVSNVTGANLVFAAGIGAKKASVGCGDFSLEFGVVVQIEERGNQSTLGVCGCPLRGYSYMLLFCLNFGNKGPLNRCLFGFSAIAVSTDSTDDSFSTIGFYKGLMFYLKWLLSSGKVFWSSSTTGCAWSL